MDTIRYLLERCWAAPGANGGEADAEVEYASSADAMAALVNDPEEFLNRHRLLYQRNPKFTGIMGGNFFGPSRATYNEQWEFAVLGSSVGVFRPHPPPVECNMFAVKMLRSDEVWFDALPAIPLPEASNDGLVALAGTGMLSGCSIVMQQRSGNTGPFLAHIQPKDPYNGVTLQDALADARFAGSNAPVRIYGAKDYGPSGRATVVGVNSGAGWTLYAQEYPDHTGDRTITRVRRFSLSHEP